ncbi:hypothetical protein COO60DRAFT_1176177 [Scenedesmus sp. NREL 46B-D3]|nr:hypothetical protein COO60DRAFT_1176177 [Scenedesmus sp. NREL 46B-D3]
MVVAVCRLVLLSFVWCRSLCRQLGCPKTVLGTDCSTCTGWAGARNMLSDFRHLFAACNSRVIPCHADSVFGINVLVWRLALLRALRVSVQQGRCYEHMSKVRLLHAGRLWPRVSQVLQLGITC